MDFAKIMLTLGAMASKDDLVTVLEKEIRDYRKAESDQEKDEVYSKIELSCSLLLSKSVAPTMNDVDRVHQEFSGFQSETSTDKAVDDMLKTLNIKKQKPN